MVLHDTGAARRTVGFVDPPTSPRAVYVAVLTDLFDPAAVARWRMLSTRCDVICGPVATESLHEVSLVGSWALRAHSTPPHGDLLSDHGAGEMFVVAARSGLGPRFGVDAGALELRLPAPQLVLAFRVGAAVQIALRCATRPLFAPVPDPPVELAVEDTVSPGTSSLPARRVVLDCGPGVRFSRRGADGVEVLAVTAAPTASPTNPWRGVVVAGAPPTRRGVCVSF